SFSAPDSTSSTYPLRVRGAACFISPFFFFSSRRRHTRSKRDWSSDVCSSDLLFDSGHTTHLPAQLYHAHALSPPAPESHPGTGRSEERRVGKEWRSRPAPDQEKKKTTRGPTKQRDANRQIQGRQCEDGVLQCA